jgi:hypothetical protein
MWEPQSSKGQNISIGYVSSHFVFKWPINCTYEVTQFSKGLCKEKDREGFMKMSAIFRTTQEILSKATEEPNLGNPDHGFN